MLRKYVVMLPLHEHAHTGLLFGRIRHSRIYTIQYNLFPPEVIPTVWLHTFAVSDD